MGINESRFSHETVEENENKIYTDYEMLNSRMSRHIHSQGDSSLCWAFSGASMIRRSLVEFFHQHNGHLTIQEKSEAEAYVKDDSFHRILRMQIVMNPIPKRLKKTETAQDRNRHEVNSIYGFLKRMLYDTVLSGKGIFELERVLEFFRKMKIPVDQITVEGDQFDFKSNFDDLYDLYA